MLSGGQVRWREMFAPQDEAEIVDSSLGQAGK